MRVLVKLLSMLTGREWNPVTFQRFEGCDDGEWIPREVGTLEVGKAYWFVTLALALVPALPVIGWQDVSQWAQI